jgi:nitrogen fixation NifU-like protein
MNNLYRENILDHYRSPRNFGKKEHFDYYSEKGNPLCGDRIGIGIKIKNNKITDVCFWGEGCAISIASASMLTSEIREKNISDVKKMGKASILNFLGVELTPTRLKCALLPLEVTLHTLGLVKITNQPLK